MGKTNVRNFAGASVGLLVLAILLFIVGIPVLGIIAILLCLIPGAFAYFGGLIGTAKRRDRKWFVRILIFGVFAALFYGLFGHDEKQSEEPLHRFLIRAGRDVKQRVGP